MIELLGEYPIFPTNFTVLNDRVLFQMTQSESLELGLCSTDGTVEGTIKLSPKFYKTSLQITTETHRFFIDDTDGVNSILSTDGTLKVTISLATNEKELEYDLENQITMRNKLFFETKRGNATKEVWVSDGAENGTFNLDTKFIDLNYLSFSEQVYKNMMLFTESRKDYTVRLWRTNLTNEGTSIRAFGWCVLHC